MILHSQLPGSEKRNPIQFQLFARINTYYRRRLNRMAACKKKNPNPMCALPSRRPRQLDKNSTAELRNCANHWFSTGRFSEWISSSGASDGTGGNLQLLGPSGGTIAYCSPRWRTLFTVPLSHNGPTHRRLWEGVRGFVCRGLGDTICTVLPVALCRHFAEGPLMKISLV